MSSADLTRCPGTFRVFRSHRGFTMSKQTSEGAEVEKSRLGIWVLWLAALVALVAFPAVAFASTAAVKEFSLESTWIQGLAQGPDGTVWYAGTTGRRENWEGRIGRIGIAGPLGESPAPIPFPTDIAVGAEGDAWFLKSGATVGRLAPSGDYSSISIGDRAYYPGGTAAAAGGGIWFAVGRGASGTDTVGRITVTGGVTEFPIPPVPPPSGEARPDGIVEGNEGDAWFTEYFGDRIGRVTPSGQMTELPLPPGSRPAGITVDAQGDIWFAEQGSDRIGRIDTARNLTEFKLPAGTFPDQIAAAADDRVWFTQGAGGTLGRLTPAGRYSEVKLPDSESDPIDIVAGTEGEVWYAAMGEGPCEGGGGTCMIWEPKNPAIVGRISPTPQRTVIKSKRARLRHGVVRVLLSCEDGAASERCNGRLALEHGGKALGGAGYSLAADQRRLVRVRIERPLRSVFGTRKKARAAAVVVASDGHSARRSITLVR